MTLASKEKGITIRAVNGSRIVVKEEPLGLTISVVGRRGKTLDAKEAQLGVREARKLAEVVIRVIAHEEERNNAVMAEISADFMRGADST